MRLHTCRVEDEPIVAYSHTAIPLHRSLSRVLRTFPSVTRFFRKPSGVGAPLNAYMFAPRRLLAHVYLLAVNPRYFARRLGVIYYQSLHPNEPWLTADALKILRRILVGDMVGFEWGSGKSTVWLARRLRHLTSVEHDARWYEEVRGMLRHHGLSNVDLRYVPASAGSSAYAGQIFAVENVRFDFILIDGNARDACIAAAAAKVKPGGHIFLDNADSNYDVSPLRDFNRTLTENGVWRTDIYVRPDRS
jgi:Methyltransferase domain